MNRPTGRLAAAVIGQLPALPSTTISGTSRQISHPPQGPPSGPRIGRDGVVLGGWRQLVAWLVTRGGWWRGSSGAGTPSRADRGLLAGPGRGAGWPAPGSRRGPGSTG